MANEIRATYDTGATLYAMIFNAAGQVWDILGDHFEEYGIGNWPRYSQALSEIAINSGQYRTTFPSLIDAGIYSVVLFEQAEGSPASTDERIGETGKMIWDGSAEIDLDDIEAYVDKIDDGTDGLSAIKAEVEGLAGAAMVGTNGANTTTPDAAGTAASLHSITDGKINTIDDIVDTILADTAALKVRLTAARAGYLDELAAANIPTDIDTLLTRLTAIRAGYLDAAISSRSSHAASAVTGGTTVAAAETNIRGADSDTLETLSDQVDAVPTVGEIDTELTANHGSGNWTRDAGTGSTLRTYTLTVAGQPLADCRIWITTDSAGLTDPIADGYTNSSGVFTFYHDYSAGQVLYIWRQKTGYNFTNPDQETI